MGSNSDTRCNVTKAGNYKKMLERKTAKWGKLKKKHFLKCLQLATWSRATSTFEVVEEDCRRRRRQGRRRKGRERRPPPDASCTSASSEHPR